MGPRSLDRGKPKYDFQCPQNILLPWIWGRFPSDPQSRWLRAATPPGIFAVMSEAYSIIQRTSKCLDRTTSAFTSLSNALCYSCESVLFILSEYAAMN